MMKPSTGITKKRMEAFYNHYLSLQQIPAPWPECVQHISGSVAGVAGAINSMSGPGVTVLTQTFLSVVLKQTFLSTGTSCLNSREWDCLRDNAEL